MHGHYIGSTSTHYDDGGQKKDNKKKQQNHRRWDSLGSFTFTLSKEAEAEGPNGTSTSTRLGLFSTPPATATATASTSTSSPPSRSSSIAHDDDDGYKNTNMNNKKKKKCENEKEKDSRPRRHISEDEKEEIEKTFQIFDTRNTGKLSYRELKMAMRALDFSVKKEEVKRLMHDHAHAVDATTLELDSQQFFQILTLKYKERDKNQDLIKAFISFDEEGKGSITFKNLKKVARDLGVQIDDEEIQAMIDEFDTDGDGKINEEEFLAIMRSDDDFDD